MGDSRQGTSEESQSYGRIVHCEFSSRDMDASREFLESVFDWRFDEPPPDAGNYLFFETPGGSRGGIRPVQPGEPGPTVTNYILVRDAEGTMERVEKGGGKILVPLQEVAGLGRFFWFQVPGGGILACWQDLD